jgi:hypothetical protein
MANRKAACRTGVGARGAVQSFGKHAACGTAVVMASRQLTPLWI